MSNNREDAYILAIIGIAKTCFTEKFGIPRQAGLAPSAMATIELVGRYNREEMVRGLEKYSHVWLQFLFHSAVSEGWKTTVRPPRLGGRERLGVFATRSPHRPNHIGLSAVKLEGIRRDAGNIMIDVSGVDLLDKTPILDLKPYIPYSDRVDDAVMNSILEPPPMLEIIFRSEAEMFCREYQRRTGRSIETLIREILREDPRPASQRGAKNEFGMSIWDVNVRWSVD